MCAAKTHKKNISYNAKVDVFVSLFSHAKNCKGWTSGPDLVHIEEPLASADKASSTGINEQAPSSYMRVSSICRHRG
jgi:hypothetical protein